MALPILQKQTVQKQAYYQRSLKDFVRDVASAGDLTALLKAAAERIQQTLKSESIAILLSDAQSDRYIVREKLGLADTVLDEGPFQCSAVLRQALKQKSKVWPLQEVKARHARRGEHAWAVLKACQAEWLVPILVREELAGFLCVGKRRARATYESEALAFMLDVSSQTALAMEGLQLRRQYRARQQELDAAREIQRNLLPRAMPKVKGCDLAALCESCTEVGGDYYDLLEFSEHKVGMIIADVVGKGAPAALLMSNLQAAVRILVNEATPPGLLAEKVNRLIAGSITPNRYITFFYGVLDTQAKTLTYTNAGHNPPLLLKADGAHIKLDKGGTVIGLFPHVNYEQEAIPLDSADLLVLYTDGVTEARNAAEEEFGEVRLREQAANRPRGAVEALLL